MSRDDAATRTAADILQPPYRLCCAKRGRRPPPPKAGRYLMEDNVMGFRNVMGSRNVVGSRNIMGFRNIIVALGLAAAWPANATDLLVTQYKNDPSGAPYAIALEKGFFKKHGVDITGIISGAGGGSSVRTAMASDLGYGDVTAAPVIAAADQGQDIKIIGIDVAVAGRSGGGRHAQFAAQDRGRSQGQEVRHQQPEIARRNDGRAGDGEGRAEAGRCPDGGARQPGRRAHRVGEGRRSTSRPCPSSCSGRGAARASTACWSGRRNCRSFPRSSAWPPARR